MELENSSLSLPAPDAPAPAEVKQSLDALLRAFEAFKSANDERLDDIEKRQNTDVLTRDKVDRLNAVVSDLSAQTRRPMLDTAPAAASTPSEHKEAFLEYVRHGNVMPTLETRDLTIGTDAQGGYTSHPELETEIGKRLRTVDSVRALATVRVIGQGNAYKKLHVADDMGVAWASETGARAKTTTPNFKEINVPLHEQYANPAASAVLLDDSAVDIEAWLADTLSDAFAASEANAFVQGTGTNQPTGILKHTTVVHTSSSAGIKFVKSGVANALPSTGVADFLLDFCYGLSSAYRQNAHWMMTRATEAKLRKIKLESNYIWQPNPAPGQAASLLGYPVAESEYMDEIAANKFPVIFGDIRAGYLIVDRQGMQILRDPFSNKPYVMFYTTRRVGGMVQDEAALRLIKIAA